QLGGQRKSDASASTGQLEHGRRAQLPHQTPVEADVALVLEVVIRRVLVNGFIHERGDAPPPWRAAPTVPAGRAPRGHALQAPRGPHQSPENVSRDSDNPTYLPPGSSSRGIPCGTSRATGASTPPSLSRLGGGDGR